jgi:hypothetical protein
LWAGRGKQAGGKKKTGPSENELGRKEKEKERREKGRWAGGSRFGPRGELGRGLEKKGGREEREGFGKEFSFFQSFQILFKL